MGDFDEVFDWVVVGSGAGAMTSALLVRQARKSVVILEKTQLVGGTTAKSGGVAWVPNNRFMAAAGDNDSVATAALYLDTLIGDGADSPGTSPEKRLAYLTEAPRMVDFLITQGVRLERAATFWPDYYDELPGACKTTRCVVAHPYDTNELGPWRDRLRPGWLAMPATIDEGKALSFYKISWAARLMFLKIALKTAAARLTRKRIVSAGAALQGRLLQAVLKAGAEIRTEAPVSELVLDKGRITGVLTVRDGQHYRIGARLGVLVNAGGFGRNQTMRDRYMPGTRAEWSQTCEGDTGEMQVEMERIGGVLAQMDQMVGYQCTPAPGPEFQDPMPSVQSITGKPHAILVDQSGSRYLNEGGSYKLYCETMFKRNETVPAVPSWAIFDSQFIDKYMLAGTFPGRKKPLAWTEEGYLRQAASIGELADAIEIAPVALEATVARWNDHVEKSIDADFHRGERAYDDWLGDPYHKPHKSLGTIASPPYYAVPVVPGDVSTFGGIVTDQYGRVLREDGSPIEGLYAAGVATASVMGKVYPGAGASIGPALTFGFVAAKHAVGQDNQQV